MKPDRGVRRVFFRLGLIDSDKDTREVRAQIQEVGKRIAEAVGERVNVIDEVVWVYGIGYKYVSKTVCTERKPLCDECKLIKICQYHVRNRS